MEKVLEAFGFGSEWVEWVMNMVTIPFFSIMLNGSPTNLFQPSHGIRQGDPNSPFLFILMVDGLSRLIHAKDSGGEIRGLTLHEEMDKQTHQQFMDDTILMGHPIDVFVTSECIHLYISYCISLYPDKDVCFSDRESH